MNFRELGALQWGQKTSNGLERTLYPLKINVFFYLKKMFQEIKSKIEIIGTYLNLVVSLEGTLGPLGKDISLIIIFIG